MFGAFACSDDKPKESFTEIFNVEGELFLSGDNLKDPFLVEIINNYLIIGNDKGSPLIELYDTQTGNKKASFLTIGNGPNEFLHIGNIQPVPGRGEIFIQDLFTKKLVKYNLLEILDDQTTPYEVIFQVEEDSGLLASKIAKSQNGIIIGSADPRGRIILLDEDDNVLTYFGQYPNKDLVDPDLTELLNAKLYGSAITVNPAMNKVALATYSAGMIDLFEITEDNTIKPIWSYQEFYPVGIMIIPMAGEFVVAHTNNALNGFTGICSTEKYVYAVFSGKKLEDKSYPYGDMVYVVSWDGKESYKFKLDREVNRLVVDHNDGVMYGVTSELDIYRFRTVKK